MFDMLFKRATEAGNKISGRLDLLQACAAAGALVAAGDGTISEDEVQATLKAIGSNPVITNAFQKPQIEQAVLKEFDKADGGTFSGKRNLMNEIKEVAAKGSLDDGEIVLMTGADVAMKGDGGLHLAEYKVLEQIAQLWGVKVESYGIEKPAA